MAARTEASELDRSLTSLALSCRRFRPPPRAIGPSPHRSALTCSFLIVTAFAPIRIVSCPGDAGSSHVPVRSSHLICPAVLHATPAAVHFRCCFPWGSRSAPTGVTWTACGHSGTGRAEAFAFGWAGEYLRAGGRARERQVQGVWTALLPGPGRG